MHPDNPAPDAEPHAVVDAWDHPHELQRLLELAVLAVPTCIGVSLVLRGAGPAVTRSALRAGWHDRPVLASLSAHLPRALTAAASDAAAELVVFAAAPRAFRDTVPDVLALLGMTSRQVTVDAHLDAPDLTEERVKLARWLNGQAVMQRAIGILLDRGLLPEDGRRELARLADEGGMTQPEAARLLIASAIADRNET